MFGKKPFLFFRKSLCCIFEVNFPFSFFFDKIRNSSRGREENYKEYGGYGASLTKRKSQERERANINRAKLPKSSAHLSGKPTLKDHVLYTEKGN